MATFKIPVRWELCGVVEIEAETLEAAIADFDANEEHIELPRGQYIDGSFEREPDIEFIEFENQRHEKETRTT